MSEDKKCPLEGENVVIAGPELPNGGRICIHHDGEHGVSMGEMHPLEHGVPLPDDAVLVSHRHGNVYDVGESVESMKKGPSQVSTKAYRDGYDRIFGKKTDASLN